MKEYYMIIAATLILTGCFNNSGPDLSPEASKKVLKNLPDWFMMTPEKEGFKYVHLSNRVA